MRNVHYGLSLLLVIISSLAGLNLLFHRHHSNPGDPIASEDELKSKEGDDDVSLDRSLPLKHETTAMTSMNANTSSRMLLAPHDDEDNKSRRPLYVFPTPDEELPRDEFGEVIRPEDYPYEYEEYSHSHSDSDQDYLDQEEHQHQHQHHDSDSDSRRLSVASATIGEFHPLDCNSNLDNAPCTDNVSDIMPTSGTSDPLIVPCGKCYVFDLPDSQVYFPGGINIKGKLKFPENKKVIVRTTSIIVQGELEIRSTHNVVSKDNESVVFEITGTENVTFAASDSPNQNACDQRPNGQCDLGPKPFIVAGGKLNIDAFPANCKTHTPILKKILEKPVKDPDDFPQFEELPSACGVSGLEYIKYDFDDGSVGNWTSFVGNSGQSIVTIDAGALKVSNRASTGDGPAIEIAPLVPSLCLVPEKVYIFTVKIKLDKSDGSNVGQPTLCETAGSDCPRLTVRARSADSVNHFHRTLKYMDRAEAPKYGEFGDYTAGISFRDYELWDNMTSLILQIDHAEIGTDITIDDFRIGLPPADLFPNPSDTCGELVMNGDAEGVGASRYPIKIHGSASSLLVVKDENMNSYFQLTKRSDSWSSMLINLDHKCLDRGVVYLASAKVRVHSESEHPFYFFIRALGGDNNWFHHSILECPAQKFSDGWVTCSGEMMVHDRLSNSTNAQLRMAFVPYADVIDVDVDYDDISIKYHRGFVKKLVVSKPDAHCWGQQSDVHVGSSIFYSFTSVVENGVTAGISNVSDNNDGTMNIELDTAPTIPIISSEENSNFAADVALVSRNVIVRGESEEENKGAYLQVLHTLNVQQKIVGVQFINMGRRSEDDRFGLQILYSGSLEGTTISMNSFYKSNYRCIVIEGSANITVSDNVGVSNVGHCIYTGPRARDNIIRNNYVSDTMAISWNERVAGSSDYHAAAFYNWNGPNSYSDNIAVGSRYYGFYCYNDWQVRLEDFSYVRTYNPRTIALGQFSNNQARSNGHMGFHFSNHEQIERIILTGLKSLKNRYHGLYLSYGQRVTLTDSFFAENAHGIEMRYVDDVEIEDTSIVGLTDETKALVKPPNYHNPCDPQGYYAWSPTGYLMHTTIWRFDQKLSDGTYLQNIGAKIKNVNFSGFDHDDECHDSIPIKFNTNEKRDGHWDYVSMFNNVHLGDGPRGMAALAAEEEGVRDIVITDVGGLSDPSGQTTATSSIVSRRSQLTTFARDECIDYWEGIAYCKNTCYRTVTIRIDQDETDDLVMKVTRPEDELSVYADQFYRYDSDNHLKGYENSHRKFSVSLPYGAYRVEFLVNETQQLVWPTFAYEVWEGKPECDSNSYANGPDFTIVEPAIKTESHCDHLIRNSDFSMGTTYWKHRNSRSSTDRGYIIDLPGKGQSGSIALGYFNRWSFYDGIGQSIDTRCLRQNADDLYEIKVWFRTENDGVLHLCDRFNNDSTVRCPEVTIKYMRYEDPSTKESLTWSYPHLAKKVMTNEANDFNLVHGVFQIKDGLELAQRAWIYIEYASTDLDFIVDDFSVDRLQPTCHGDLLRNGDFESGFSTYWENYGTLKFDIIDRGGSKAIQMYEKDQIYQGLQQKLYIDKSCISVGDRYQVVVKFQMKNSQGSDISCDLHAEQNEILHCGIAHVESYSPSSGHSRPTVAHAAAIAPDKSDGWSVMAGIFTMSESDVNDNDIVMKFRLVDSHIDNTVTYDDITMTPIPKTCDQMILNPSFQDGTSSFWRYYNNRRIDYSIISDTPGGTDYALLFDYGEGYNWQFLYQDLDSRCVVEGEELEITAKIKILDSADLTNALSCDPSDQDRNSETHCPTMFLGGYECDGANVESDVWNESQDTWITTDYNKFQFDITIDAHLATCKIIRLGIGRYTPGAKSLLVSEVKFGKKTTEAPTKAPTFRPTELVTRAITEAPSSRPTTTDISSCPPVDSAHVTLDADSAILVRTGPNVLCTLTKVTLDASGTILKTMPLARSYNQYNWEVSAGELASSIFVNGIACYSPGCQVDLPPIQPNEEYRLKSYSKPLHVNTRDTFARFLETATYGILPEDLDALEAANGQGSPIVSWMQLQMDPATTPITSHREYWRETVNPRAPVATLVGIPDHPCHKNSRWRRFTFVRNDAVWFMDKHLRVEGSGPYTLYLDGAKRTIVDDFWLEKDSGFQFDPTFMYIICRVDERVGGRIGITLQDGRCVDAENPAVNLTSIEGSSRILDIAVDDLATIDEYYTNGEEFILQNALTDSLCSTIPAVFEHGDEGVFGRVSDGTWIQFDPRLDLETNTVESPLSDGGKGTKLKSGGNTYCSNVPRTFLNEQSCQQSSNACQSTSTSDELEILLDHNTITELNMLTGRYVYRIEGLSVVDKYDGSKLAHPCTAGLRSRWIPTDNNICNPTLLNSATNETLSELLFTSSDINPHLKDIYFPSSGMSCNAADTNPEIEILVGGVCWQRVNEEFMSIYDMTYWVGKHPGGSYHIKKWSQNNGTTLVFPNRLGDNQHPMDRWYNNYQKFTFIGRFGDYIRIRDLPNEFRTEAVTSFYDNDTGSSISFTCGSPGEVSNNPVSGLTFDLENNGYVSGGYDTGSNRQNVWYMISLSASDQLRQRVAWSLAQMLVVVTDAIGSANRNTEWFFAYHDIFIRNAFGNYRDILREISYSPLMAENLSFLQSKSSAYLWERYRIKAQADENFAREIMQLFSMGVKKLHMDGSLKLDAQGSSQLAYTNDDIMSLSRAWTGFDLQPVRSNIEGGTNRLDPMRIEAQWRDRFPKTDTSGGYIGDHYPLCVDLPEKAFLKKGAVYRFLGSSPLPELSSDPALFATDDSIQRMVLASSSQLLQKLCNSNNGICNFENSVTIDSPLICTGNECNVDSVRVVQVGESAFYEYVRVPCVNQVFYQGGVKISPRYRWDPVMCANPKLPDAAEACCQQLNSFSAERNNVFDGERMLLSTAQNRCSAADREICDFNRVPGDRHKNSLYFWTSDDCHVKVKVNLEGMVTVVHHPSDSTNLVPHVDETNENYFKVYWKNNNFPKASDNCGICEVVNYGGSCLCNTVVAERQVYNTPPSSKREALEKLVIGGPDPESFASNTYTSTSNTATGITTYLKNGIFDVNTIFEFTDDKGRKFHVKNSMEIVVVNGGEHRFRNAPHFMNLVPTEATKRDAQYETEATLDNYFYHDNTAPFLSMRLIQRLTSSNPSPRYILVVATAFKEGLYVAENGQSFGTGRYGDLAAMFASIYLDREARSIILDQDPSHGSLREPILKLMSVMRSMKFRSKHPVTYLRQVKRNIGQNPHAFDTVFSFFLPEYKPYGRVGDASLVSPEATLLDMPKIVGTINAFRSLVKFGLSSCAGGFGWQGCREREYLTSPLGQLEYGMKDPNAEFPHETFEGPSLEGGFDNQWVGRYFYPHNLYGRVVIDPLDTTNHVYHPSFDYNGRFYSPLQTRTGSTVVKFKYFASQNQAGGCIGYTDDERLVSQSWIYCDARSHYAPNIMTPNATSYIVCQFEIPNDMSEFRIAVGDRVQEGDAYFDDIQVTAGTGTTCDGVTIGNLTPSGSLGFSTQLVDDLATLLTAGRLSPEHRGLIRDAYNDAGSANDGLKIAQQLILSSSEFHTTNNVKSTNEIREEVTFPEPGNKPYRAVVYIMFSGGADSYNILAPYDCTKGKDMYQEYLDVRQQVALSRQDMLPVNAENQICETFGIHPDLTAVRDLYVENDLLFFANTGVLSQPVDKSNWNLLTETQLFSHNHMQRESKRLDPHGTSSGTGVLGRMSDVLSSTFGSNVGSFSVDRFSVALAGQSGVRDAQMIVNRDGVPSVYLEQNTKELMKGLHKKTTFDSGYFAEMWSSAFTDSLNINDVLSTELEGIQVQTEFPTSYLSSQLKTVAKLIATRTARGVDVDTFYVEVGGFDTHAKVEENLSARLIEVNEGIAAFAVELKLMGLWNNVVTIQTSDFARTLNPNSGDGTDHAWGGHYMMFGGAVKGGKILGEYPDSLTTDGDLTLGRGRIIPSTPWDAVFKGIAKWAGVPDNKVNMVCPNLGKFGSFLFEDDDMFYFGPGSPCSIDQECDDNNDEGTTDVCVLGKCQNNPISGVCGNGICEPTHGEYCSNCPKDCVAPWFCNKLGQDGDFEGVSASPNVRGVRFDIEAAKNIALSGIDINVNDAGDVGAQVFFKVGTTNATTATDTRRLEENLDDWTNIYDNNMVPVVDGMASLAFAIVVEEGSTMSLYVTFSDANRMMVQSDFSAGDAVKENEDLKVYAGQAVGSDINDETDTDLKAIAGTLSYDFTDEDISAPPPPTPSPPPVGSGGGDPHFSTFNGEYFSYHGECDLVLLNSLGFASGLGLLVHIRTTRVEHPTYSFSYISGIAVKLGNDVLEAMDDGSIILNGNDLELDLLDDSTFAGFPVTKTTKGKQKNIYVYDLNLDGINVSTNSKNGNINSNINSNSSIQIRANTKSGMLFVDVNGVFNDSVGLLGPSTTTGLFARDGETDLTGEWNTFGEEWQVIDTEPKLFQENRIPQYPAGCRYETKQSTKRLRRRRRLMELKEDEEVVTIETATDACSKASGRQKEFCIGDIMATGDLELAQDPFYH